MIFLYFVYATTLPDELHVNVHTGCCLVLKSMRMPCANQPRFSFAIVEYLRNTVTLASSARVALSKKGGTQSKDRFSRDLAGLIQRKQLESDCALLYM